MFRRSTGVILTARATISTLTIFASVWADHGEALETREDAGTASISVDLQRKEGEIDRDTGRLVEVGRSSKSPRCVLTKLEFARRNSDDEFGS